MTKVVSNAGSSPGPAELLAAPLIDAGWREAFVAGLRHEPDWLDACARVVADRQAADPHARDGYSRVACGLVAAGRAVEALAWFERDAAADRMGRWQFLQHLETLLAQGRESDAAARVEAYYAKHPDARDGWSTLAFAATKAGDDDRAATFWRRDHALGRLTTGPRLRLADMEIAMGNFRAATELIASVYRDDARLQDGHARLAYQRSRAGDWQQARQLLELDLAAGRLSPKGELELAAAWAHAGEMRSAEARVEAVYASHHALRDGWAGLAWAEVVRGDRAAGLALLQRDHRAGRMSGVTAVHYAGMVATHSIPEAIAIIEQAYASDANVRDGFVKLASIALQVGNGVQAREWYARDHAAGRASTAALLDYARLVAEEEPTKAADLVEEAYGQDKSLRGYLTGLGWGRLQAGDVTGATMFLEREYAAGRMSPHAQLSFACVIARDDPTRAARLVEETYGRDADVREGFTRVGLTAQGHGLILSAREWIARDVRAGRAAADWQAQVFRAWRDERRGHSRVAELACALARWMPPAIRDALAEAVIRGNLDGASFPQFIRDWLLVDGRLRLADAELEIGDEESLRIILEEILVFECYWFATPNPRPRVLDGGANIGLATWYFRKLYPEATILAFEPDPTMAGILRRNVERNGWTNVEVLECALAAKAGTAEFHSTPGETIAGSLTDRTSARGLVQTMNEVQCRPLSDFLDQPVDFLKLDIEGAEREVFEESEAGLKQVRHLFCEVHRAPGRGHHELLDIVQRLETAGFTVELTGPSRLTPATERGIEAIRVGRSHQLWATRAPEDFQVVRRPVPAVRPATPAGPTTTGRNLMHDIGMLRTSFGQCLHLARSLGIRPATVIDVGVALGTPELYEVFPEAEFLLVEPVKEFQPHLEAIARERRARWFLAAAGNRDGMTTIAVTPDRTTSALGADVITGADTCSREVELVRLDTLCARSGVTGPYVIKVDVQGHELAVIEGCAGILAETEIIVLEVNFFAFTSYIPEFAIVIATMQAKGFVVYDVMAGHNRPLDLARAQADVVFVRAQGALRRDHRWGAAEHLAEFLAAKRRYAAFRALMD